MYKGELVMKNFPGLGAPRRILRGAPKLNIQWVVGFTSGEGNFMIGLRREGKLGKIPQLRFQLTQHIRDEELFRRLVSFLGCGSVYVRNSNKREAVEFSVQNFTENIDKIIPIFRDNPIFPSGDPPGSLRDPVGVGVKALDFAD